MRAALLLLAPAVLTGCTFKKTDILNEAEAKKYDPTMMARVRLISGGSSYGGFITGQSCEHYYNVSKKNAAPGKAPEGWVPSRTSPPGESLDIFYMAPSDYQNNVVGMPASTVSSKIDDTRQYYDEHVVPAGQTLISFIASVSSRSSCSSAPVSFVPQAGKDYEIRQVFATDFPKAYCRNAVFELGAGHESPVVTNYCVTDKSGVSHTASAGAADSTPQ